MWHARQSFPSLLLLSLLGLLPGCTTPYRPPIAVHGSTSFPGIATVVGQAGAQPVDVLLVHGMCTHDANWAERQIDRIAGVTADHAPAQAGRAGAGIELVERTRRIAGGTVRFHAIVWSPLTTALKRQLDFDTTGTPTDCASANECRPRRAQLNGYVKDHLLNDCLADAVIYEGARHAAIRDAMVQTVAQVLDRDRHAAGEVPLVVVAESLGSKMLFDALTAMLESWEPHTRALGQQAARRLGLLFMGGNQLPILSLAEQPAAMRAAAPQDALQRFLDLRRHQPFDRRAEALRRLAVVAFTDPNDLLSYRLLPARYAAPDVAVADVLVSNDATWLGLVEYSVTAHMDYLMNPDVGVMMACGWPAASRCRVAE